MTKTDGNRMITYPQPSYWARNRHRFTARRIALWFAVLVVFAIVATAVHLPHHLGGLSVAGILGSVSFRAIFGESVPKER